MIYNAKVIEAEIKTYDDYHNPGDVAIVLRLHFIDGDVNWEINADKINDVFKILDIRNFKDIIGASCRIKIEDKVFKNLGHFIEDYWLYKN